MRDRRLRFSFNDESARAWAAERNTAREQVYRRALAMTGGENKQYASYLADFWDMNNSLNTAPAQAQPYADLMNGIADTTLFFDQNGQQGIAGQTRGAYDSNSRAYAGATGAIAAASGNAGDYATMRQQAAQQLQGFRDVATPEELASRFAEVKRVMTSEFLVNGFSFHGSASSTSSMRFHAFS